MVSHVMGKGTVRVQWAGQMPQVPEGTQEPPKETEMGVLEGTGSWNTLGKFLPQGLCRCCSLCPDTPPAFIHSKTPTEHLLGTSHECHAIH